MKAIVLGKGEGKTHALIEMLKADPASTLVVPTLTFANMLRKANHDIPPRRILPASEVRRRSDEVLIGHLLVDEVGLVLGALLGHHVAAISYSPETDVPEQGRTTSAPTGSEEIRADVHIDYWVNGVQRSFKVGVTPDLRLETDESAAATGQAVTKVIQMIRDGKVPDS